MPFFLLMPLTDYYSPQALEQPQGTGSRSAVAIPSSPRPEVEVQSSGSSSSKRASRLKPWEKLWSLDYRSERSKQ